MTLFCYHYAKFIFMRQLITLITLLCVHTISYGQVKNIEYSNSFDEPENGWSKVLQLNNGNTFFFIFDDKKGVSVTVYRPDRSIASRRVLTSNLWDTENMKDSKLEGIYEIDGQVVIFIQQLIKRVPILYRVQLNADNGAIVKQKEIGRLPKYKLFAAYAMAFGNVDEEDFIVEKDPESDAYAVIHYNTFSSESNKRIEVVHYTVNDGEHSEINRSFYDAGDFKYVTYVGMYVMGTESVYVAAYGYNTTASGGEDSRVFISKLKPADQSFTHLQLEFTDDFKRTEGILKYHKPSGMIQMLTLTFVESEGIKNYYISLMNYIDPQSLQIVKSVPIPTENIQLFAKRNELGIEKFSGMPIDLIFNQDNTSTILMEEISTYVSERGHSTLYLKNIGIATLDEKGQEQDGYAIIKNQEVEGEDMGNLYHAKKGKGLWSYKTKRGMQMYTPNDSRSFFSYDYINSNTNKNYVIFNVLTEDYGVEKFDDLHYTKRVSSTVAAYYMLENGQVTKHYLFGRGTDKNTKFLKVESSHFNEENNTYATLMVKRDGRHKKAYISWITFE